MKKALLNDWWKQFLTGVMGTAIGVGLTFGVSNLVDNHKKAQAQRQTATMAVYDIDEMIRALKEDLQLEDALFPIAMYLSNHPDRMDKVGIDTLRQALTYLMEDVTETHPWANDAKEKAFTGSMDAWQNLENTQFYDNVQRCYLCRKELLAILSKDAVFHKPLSEDVLNAFIAKTSGDDLDDDGSLTYKALGQLLKQIYRMPETTRFLRMYTLRDRVFNQYIDELNRLNRENKFLMSLSDEEMEAYIRKNVQKTRPANPKLVAGTWVVQMNEGRQSIRFLPDHTMELILEQLDVANIHVDADNQDIRMKVPVSCRLGGEWTLEGDSLFFTTKPDRSEILSIGLDPETLPEAAREAGRKWLESYRANLNQQLQSGEVTQRNCVSFDLTGNTMFWSYRYTNAMGQPETARHQLNRKQE
ncbi:MAG: hypothetical protein IJV01_05345 [Bacteroidales bacterium]|nr:hypothetical protein [Bacteroidales bacterium]